MGQLARRQLAKQGPAAIVDLIPLLPDASLPAAVGVARRVADPDERARALLAIRGRTGWTDLDGDILAAARASAAPATHLLAWARDADRSSREPVLLEAVAAAPRWDRGPVLGDVIPLAPAGLLAQLVRLAVIPDDALPGVFAALDARPDDVPKELRRLVLEVAVARAPAEAPDALLTCVMHLIDPAEREGLVGRWVEEIRAAAAEADEADAWNAAEGEADDGGDETDDEDADAEPDDAGPDDDGDGDADGDEFDEFDAFDPSDADPRIPAALRWLSTDDRRALAVQLLGRAGRDPAVDAPALVEALDADDTDAVFAALLAGPGQAPAGALEALVSAMPAASRVAAAGAVATLAEPDRVRVRAALVTGDDAASAAILAAVASPDDAAAWARILLRHGPLGPGAAAEALRIAGLLPDGAARLHLLALAAASGAEGRAEAVAEILGLLPDNARALDWQAWERLAASLEPDEAQAALDVATARLRGESRADAVRILAPALDDDRFAALLAKHAPRDPETVQALLEGWADTLTPGGRALAREAVRAMGHPGARLVAQATIAAASPDGEGDSPSSILAEATAEDDETVGEVLRHIGARVPPSEAVDAALSMEDEEARLFALGSLEELLPEAERARVEPELRLARARGLAGGGGMGAGGGAEEQPLRREDALLALGTLVPADAEARPRPPRETQLDDVDEAAGGGPVGIGADPAGDPGGGSTGGGQHARPPDHRGEAKEDEEAEEDGDPAAGADPGARPAKEHTAYGLLDTPAEVVVGLAFTLEVGLAHDPVPGVAGPPLHLPPIDAPPDEVAYWLDVRIAGPGFEPAPGQALLLRLPVSRADPYPRTAARLVATADAAQGARAITAEYSVNGERLGDAVRYVEVVADDAARSRPATDRVETGVNVPVPTGESVPDLTITIRESDPPGSALFTFDSPHRDRITPNPAPVVSRIGDALAWLTATIERIDNAAGAGVAGDVLGMARRIGDLVPGEVLDAIYAAAEAAGGPPSILLLCEEAVIPWELAYLQDPLVPGTDLPHHLGAQARVGRWLTPAGAPSAHRATRPAASPPRSKSVGAVVAVWGDYAETDWENLAHAKEEGRAMARRYGAVHVVPKNDTMFALLQGTPAADLVHFAVHGTFRPDDGGGEDGIILTDGGVLHADEIVGRDLAVSPATGPVVFLNACQVGATGRSLGSYQGIAAAFVTAGASAVVAPLWRIDDDVARDMALAFYEGAARGESFAELLRREREGFKDAFATASATPMAYLLFGHPSFTIDGLGKE